MNEMDPIQYAAGVGPKMAEYFYRLGVETVGDLLRHYPRRYLDLSHPQRIQDVLVGDINVFQAEVKAIQSSRSNRKQMSLLKATLADDSGEIQAIWFNQPFLATTLKVGSRWIFYGRVERNFRNEISLLSPQFERQAKMIAIYPETEGLTSRYIRTVVEQLFLRLKIEEVLPRELLEQENLIGRSAAYLKIHQPKSWSDIDLARNHLAFEEMLILSLRMQLARQLLRRKQAVSIPINPDLLQQFVKGLSFTLTNAQKKAIWQIVKDLSQSWPMNRLLNGDVGSGKTVVAAMSAYCVAKSGYQTAMMAPTEILAYQHYETLKKLLEPLGVGVDIRTSNKREGKDGGGGEDVLVGTHALIKDKKRIPRLAFVVVDEQHRFGVKQREILRQKSDLALEPHFLSMTATPIPRTLALSLYGDLDISILDELPPGRQKIFTRIVSPNQRQQAYRFIENEIKAGRQAFVICPLIEHSQKTERQSLASLWDIDKKTVLDEFRKLDKEIFPHRRIGLLHGRLKSEEKERVLAEFKDGKLDIIVSTSVIEVGIDVPNATVVMVEGAENFGLAQLWQFRGRVGRGPYKSYCFLFTEVWSDKIKARLESVVSAKNGFQLAEADLAIRGPGEIFGVAQSGLPDFKMASLSDLSLINRTRQAAIRILEADPTLQSWPALRRLVDQVATRHLE